MAAAGRRRARRAQFALATPTAHEGERLRIAHRIGGDGVRTDALGLHDEAALEHAICTRRDAFV